MPLKKGEKPKRLPLPKRFAAALTEPAYHRLRQLNEAYGLSNNYLLTVLLERLDEIADADRLDAAYRDFIDEYGAPEPRRAGEDETREDKTGDGETER